MNKNNFIRAITGVLLCGFLTLSISGCGGKPQAKSIKIGYETKNGAVIYAAEDTQQTGGENSENTANNESGVSTGVANAFFLKVSAAEEKSLIATRDSHAENQQEETNISYEPLNIEKNKSVQLYAELEPKEATNKVSWSSENEDIAKVDENGKITASAKLGETKIKAKTDNNVEAELQVTVKTTQREDDCIASILDLAGKVGKMSVSEALAESRKIQNEYADVIGDVIKEYQPQIEDLLSQITDKGIKEQAKKALSSLDETNRSALMEQWKKYIGK